MALTPVTVANSELLFMTVGNIRVILKGRTQAWDPGPGRSACRYGGEGMRVRVTVVWGYRVVTQMP